MEKIGSIFFLILFFGVPVFIVVLLVYSVFAKGKQAKKLAELASLHQWIFEKGKGVYIDRLTQDLQEEFFSIREGRHHIAYVMQGYSQGMDFRYAHYHYSGPPSGGTDHHLRRSGDYSLFILPRKTPGIQFWMIKLPSQILSLADKLTGKDITVPQLAGWKWGLSNVAPPPGISDNYTGEALNNLLETGAAVFLMDKYFILSLPLERKCADIPDLLKQFSQINMLINN